MFEMNADHALSDLVEAALPVGSKHALYVVLDLRLENPKNERERASTFLHFVFFRPSNYTKVWAADERKGCLSPEEFEMTSDHDSCWRSDGLRPITDVYFDLAKRVNPDIAPAKLRQWCMFWKIERVEIAYETDPRYEGDTYRKKLTKIESIRS